MAFFLYVLYMYAGSDVIAVQESCKVCHLQKMLCFSHVLYNTFSFILSDVVPQLQT